MKALYSPSVRKLRPEKVFHVETFLGNMGFWALGSGFHFTEFEDLGEVTSCKNGNTCIAYATMINMSEKPFDCVQRRRRQRSVASLETASLCFLLPSKERRRYLQLSNCKDTMAFSFFFRNKDQVQYLTLGST
jgi:hypothetical protein